MPAIATAGAKEPPAPTLRATSPATVMAEPVVMAADGAVANVEPVKRLTARVKPKELTLPPSSNVAPDWTVTTPGRVVPAKTCVLPRMLSLPCATVRLPSETLGPSMAMLFVPTLVSVKPANSRVPNPPTFQPCVPPMEASAESAKAWMAFVCVKLELLTMAPALPTPDPAMVTVRPKRLMLLATTDPERSRVAPAATVTACIGAPRAASPLMRSVPALTKVAPV